MTRFLDAEEAREYVRLSIEHQSFLESVWKKARSR
jgi:hypothetical protein